MGLEVEVIGFGEADGVADLGLGYGGDGFGEPLDGAFQLGHVGEFLGFPGGEFSEVGHIHGVVGVADAEGEEGDAAGGFHLRQAVGDARVNLAGAGGEEIDEAAVVGDAGVAVILLAMLGDVQSQFDAGVDVRAAAERPPPVEARNTSGKGACPPNI